MQYLIEGVIKVRALKFEGHPAIPEGLDLIDESEQITHQVNLEDPPLDAQARRPAAQPLPVMRMHGRGCAFSPFGQGSGC